METSYRPRLGSRLLAAANSALFSPTCRRSGSCLVLLCSFVFINEVCNESTGTTPLTDRETGNGYVSSAHRTTPWPAYEAGVFLLALEIRQSADAAQGALRA